MAAIEWYGPLIDLSDAASHVGDYVQLLVLVRACRSRQELKSSRNRSVLRTYIHVGDDSNPQFSILSWDKHIISKISAGDIVLMQNVQITVYGGILEAVTLQCSSFLHLVHLRELSSIEDVDKLMACLRLGSTTKDKLKAVISWSWQTRMHDLDMSHVLQPRMEAAKNWKINGEKKVINCISVSEVLCLNYSCHVRFHGCVREIHVQKPNGSWYFIGKRSYKWETNIIDELICWGCKLCGTPVDSCLSKQMPSSLYCDRSSNHFHEVCWIYKPFQIYVCDESGKVSLMVKNIASEILFGNITAEGVKLSLEQGVKLQHSDHSMSNGRHSNFEPEGQSAHVDESGNKNRCPVVKSTKNKRIDFFRIWLILLKLLLQHEGNSPFRFEVSVNCEADSEHAVLELVSFRIPLK